MPKILLIRHGQASFEADNYDQLSAIGIEQSKRLGEWLARQGLQRFRVAQGPMARHRQTAQACCAEIPDAPALADRLTLASLAEYDHVEVLARYRPDLADPASTKAALANEANPRRAFQQIFSAAIARWTSGEHDADYTESWTGFRQRCIDALLELSTETELDTLVFTSGGPISVMVQHVLGCPPEKATELSFVLANASITRLHARGQRLGLTGFNDYTWLESMTHASDSEPDLITFR